MDEHFLTPAELGERWGIPPGTLAQWRHAGNGPTYLKLGGAVRYRLRDVEAFESDNLVGAR